MAQAIEIIGGDDRNRTGVHGFAIRCVTTPPRRRTGAISRFWVRASQGVITWVISFLFRACSVHLRFSLAWRARIIWRAFPAYLRIISLEA